MLMVIDTSAIIAVLLNEATAARVAQAIETGSPPLISAANLPEASIVIESRKGEAGGRELDLFTTAPRSRLSRSTRTRRRSPGSAGGALARAGIRPD